MSAKEKFEIEVWEDERSAGARIKKCPGCGKPVELKRFCAEADRAVQVLMTEYLNHRSLSCR